MRLLGQGPQRNALKAVRAEQGFRSVEDLFLGIRGLRHRVKQTFELSIRLIQ